MWFAWFLIFSCNIHQFIPLGKSLSWVKVKSKCDTEKQNPTYFKSLHIYLLILILILDLILNAIKSFKYPRLKSYFFSKSTHQQKKKLQRKCIVLVMQLKQSCSYETFMRSLWIQVNTWHQVTKSCNLLQAILFLRMKCLAT